MNFHFGRVRLLPETRLHRAPLFDVAMIGHLERDASLDYLFNNPAMLEDICTAGYSELLDLLRAEHEKKENAVHTHSLQGLPIPLRSVEEFQQLFSLSGSEPAGDIFVSRLGGSYPWLPLAINDFFQADVMQLPRRLWIIVVAQAKGSAAFLTPDSAVAPASNAQPVSERKSKPGDEQTADLTPDSAAASASNTTPAADLKSKTRAEQIAEVLQRQPALLRVLDLPNLGLLCLPDFERLHIPPSLTHIPRLRVANPVPAFLPCSTNTNDGIADANPIQTAQPDESIYFVVHLQQLLRVIATYRRDVNLLLAFPFDVDRNAELPQYSQLAAAQLEQWKQGLDAHLLRHVQLVFPYLQDARGNLSSPCALLAGQTLFSSVKRGEWRSIAGVALPTMKHIFPLISLKLCAQLRDQIGLAVVREENATVQLDDERLPVPYVASQPSTNSGELARFMGGLQRALEELGLSLVFENQNVVDQSEIVLREFFTRLHAQGALRGRRPEDAFSIRRERNDSGQVLVEIELAPAIAIDRIQVDLRCHNNNLQLEVRHG